MRELTKYDVLEQVTRLVNAFGMPFGVDPDGQAEAHLTAYRRAKVTLEQLRAAIDTALTLPGGGARDGRFPEPVDIVGIIRRTPNPDAIRPLDDGTCRRCGLVRFAAGYQAPGRVPMLRIRCGCPTAGDEGWWTPAALACVETERHMPKAPPDYATNPQYRGQARADTHQLRLA